MYATLRDVLTRTKDIFDTLKSDNDVYGIRVLYTRTGAHYPLLLSNPDSVELWELLNEMEVFVLSSFVSTSPGDRAYGTNTKLV